jgi:hypothetical protein
LKHEGHEKEKWRERVIDQDEISGKNLRGFRSFRKFCGSKPPVPIISRQTLNLIESFN